MLNNLRKIYHKYSLRRYFITRTIALLLNYLLWKTTTACIIIIIQTYQILFYIRIIKFNILWSTLMIYRKTGLLDIGSKIRVNLEKESAKVNSRFDRFIEVGYINNNIRKRNILSNKIEYEVGPCNILNSKTPEYMSNKVKFINYGIDKFKITDATIIGQSDIVGEKNTFFHLFFHNLSHVKISEELHRKVFFIKLFFGLGDRIILFTKPQWYLRNFKNDGKYFFLVGSTTSNYAHWITEHLPKILFIEDEEFNLIIDSNIHQNLKSSIGYVLKNKKVNIIEIDPFKKFFFEELNFINLHSNIPFQFRDIKKSPIKENDTNFNKVALLKLRENCLDKIINKKAKKIFLIRSSHYRDFLNQDEVSDYFIENGFVTIDPSKLSFTDQVETFSSATHIVGQSGAGFANILFANNTCKILMFCSNIASGNYRYYSNIASIVGQQLYYFRCNNVLNSANIHTDINADIDSLRNKINEIEFFK